jgi:pimeloyl-ACP methyl ester carboxylesterase
MKRIVLGVLALLAVCLQAGGGAFAATPPIPYVIVDPTFAALPGIPSQQYWGVEAGAAYRIEVPQPWNGKLVLYAHGFRGNGPVLFVTNPVIREFLLRHGYAWAASSYSKNFYDVRQGVLDTHALNAVFQKRVGKTPSSTYITGHSMGGHITGVLIERYPHDYVGALPMCGVMGDVALFDYFLDYNLVAQDLASVKAVFPPPATYLTTVVPQVMAGLGGAAFPATLNEQGEQLRAVIEQRSGGTRLNFKESFEAWADFLFTLYGDGKLSGIASGNIATNLGTTYRFNQGYQDADRKADEHALNRTVLRVAPDLMARFFHGPDDLENIPPIEADFQIPVLTMHTIGDLFVPFSMEQIYARRAKRTGRSDLLVQRAYRDLNHCGFAPQEEARAFADLVNWVENEVEPAGDAILDNEKVADPQFGCRFTQSTRPPYPACAP